MRGVLLMMSLVSLVAGYKTFRPMVAFKCGKPAMHMTKSGWKQDLKTDCLKDPVDVLKYCRKVYPHLDITNALESSHEVMVDKWCTKDVKHCKSGEAESVRPVRCIVGAFSSDALLVPDGCSFKHFRDEKRCRTPQQLRAIAEKRCTTDGRELHSFEWLLPCGVDLLTGVEFVCCPWPQQREKLSKKHGQKNAHRLTDEQYEENDIIAVKPVEHKIVPKKGVEWNQYWDDSKAQVHPENVEPAVKQAKLVTYDHYISGKPMKSYRNEHDRFHSALGVWEDRYQEKLKKLKTDWADAKERVHSTHRNDPRGASKLEETINKRFHKMLEALKAEGDKARNQLDRVHQDRVRKEMADKKKRAFDRFLDALAQPEQTEDKIRNALLRYIKLEEKDKSHTLSRHQHLLNVDSGAVAMERSLMPTHIKEINMRINQSLEFVKAKVDKKIQDNVLRAVQQYIGLFVDLDQSIRKAILSPDVEAEKEQPDLDEKSSSSESESKEQLLDEKLDASSEALAPTDEDLGGDGGIVYDKAWNTDNSEWGSKKWKKHDDWEDERSFKSNVANDQAALEQGLVSNKLGHSGLHAGAIVGLVAGTATLVLAIALVIRRHRQRRRRPPIVRHTFVDPSPEEQHVASMQAKGYENPTYKYFETQGTA